MALDLIEVLVTKQPEQLLILQLLELLLNIIQRLYQAEAGPPAQDRPHLHVSAHELPTPGFSRLRLPVHRGEVPSQPSLLE